MSDATVEALFRGTANRSKISRDEFLRLFPGKGENFPGSRGGEKWQNSGRSRSVDEDGDGDSAEEEGDNDERQRERWRWRRPRRKGERV